jgi:glucose-1-phosphate cytidylyltransferase
MKTVILAGGFGTRISEETGIRPKPMVEVGGWPILWHIMKMYSAHGHNDFVICCGYKGYMIKEFFANYFLRRSDVTFDIKKNNMHVHQNDVEPWKVTLIETGENTMTGGRIKRIQEYVDGERFFLTYGDGVSDVDFDKLLQFHEKNESYATLTAVQPPGRFGAFHLDPDAHEITHFREKPSGDSAHDTAWINGGFFVMEPEIFNFIEGDASIWEREPMEAIAVKGKLMAYKHHGYWQNMDTLRDRKILEEVWSGGNAPWKKWD